MRRLLLPLMLSLAVPASAGPLQDAYNAAQAALDAGRNAEAATAFADLLAKMPNADKPGNRTAALIRARLGSARLRLNDAEAARGPLEAALAALPSATEQDRRERVLTLIDLGHALELLQDRQAALSVYRDGLTAAQGLGNEEMIISARVAIARLSLFADPALARRELDAAIPTVERLLASSKDQLGDLYALRARIELNHGDYAAANLWLDKALKVAGGLGQRVSVFDTRIRSDLGILAALRKDRDTAHKYFAYTGAGHLPDGGVLQGADTPLPACGAATDIAPSDMVVMEFSIDADGGTVAPTTIYSSHPGVIEAAFERSVARWSWNPQALGKLPAFWRNSVRLQLRCSDAGKRGDLFATFRPAVDRWMQTQGYAPAADAASDATRLPLLRAELARRADPQTLPVLIALAGNSLVDATERVAILARISLLLAKANAPNDVQTLFDLRYESALFELPNRQKSSATGGPWIQRWDALLARTAARGASGSRGAALIDVTYGSYLEMQGRLPAAETRYRAALATPASALPDADPIRQVALLRIASLAAANAQLGAAREALAATGLSPDQCAIADIRPIGGAGGRVTSADFPTGAIRWGFEGFASVAYDIDTAGGPANVRAVISYPPFIFADATEKIVGKFRFKPIFRDGATSGCNGMMQRVMFRIPGRS